MKIRNKLVMFTFVISIIPIIITALVTYQKSVDTLMEKQKKFAELSTQNAEAKIKNRISQSIRDVTFLSSFLSKQGIGVVEILKDVKEASAEYEQVFFGDEATGKLYVYPEREIEAGFDARTQQWYGFSMSRDYAVSKPYVNELTQKNMITITKTVSADGKTLGVVGIDLNFDELAKDISSVKIGDLGYVYVIHGTGTALIHPDKELMGKSMTNFSHIRDIQINGSGEIKYKWNNKDKLGIFTTIDEYNWIIIGEMDYGEIKSSFNSTRIITIILILITMAISFAGAYILGVNILRGLGKITESAKNIVQGDYTSVIVNNRKDEIGTVLDEFNEVIASQKEVVKNIKERAEELYGISKESGKMSRDSMESIKNISYSVEQIESGMESNASSLVEASGGIESVAKAAVAVAELSQGVGKKVALATSMAENGNRGIGEILATMNDISHRVEEASVAAVEVDNQTKKITSFTETIRKISEQTNLLALNAAIEAARAGESGKGFAVVADEVRKLAEQSRNAADSIEEIIEGLFAKNSELVNKMDNGIQMVRQGDRKVNDVGRELIKIIEGVREINHFINEIVKASEAQSASTQEMAAVVTDITNIVQRSKNEVESVAGHISGQVGTIEEILIITGRLEEMAGDMNSLMERFKISGEDEDGNGNIKEISEITTVS